MKQYDTVIWDLDGTLIDSFGLCVEILAVVLPKNGYVLPDVSVIEKNYHGSLDDLTNSILGGNIPTEVVGKIVDDFVDEQNTHYEVIDRHLYKDAAGLAQRGKEAGLFQMIVSNRDHTNRRFASPRSIVQRSILRPLIDEVICGDDSQYRKPKPQVMEFLKRPIESLGKILVIGDQFVDAEFAHNLGADSVIVRRDGSDIPHIERLHADIHEKITKVDTLDGVSFIVS